MAEKTLRGELARLSGALDLPGDLIAGVPRVELTGCGEAVIEQHRGIAHFSPDEVCIRVRGGIVRVTGSSLSIRRMNRAQIALTGCVAAVALEFSL